MYVSIREIDENTGNRKVDHEPNKEGNQYQSLTKLAHDPISIDPSRTKEALLSTKHYGVVYHESSHTNNQRFIKFSIYENPVEQSVHYEQSKDRLCFITFSSSTNMGRRGGTRPL